MHKDFDGWNDYKKRINSKSNPPHFSIGDVRWCSVGVNVGDEQDGKNKPSSRPVLIIKKFNHKLFYAVPLTTSTKINRYYFQFIFKVKTISAMTSQMRAYDAKRLGRRLGTVSKTTLKDIIKEIKDTF